MRILASFLSLCLTMASVAQQPEAKSTAERFLIDPSKAYAYLKFDHIGERQPPPGEEAGEGLWLRLVNNCTIPILVATFHYGESGSALGVYHNVVRVTATAPSLPPKDSLKPMPPAPAREPPSGYSVPELISTTTIAPGANLLFSVPTDHVRPLWYLEVRFYFELPNDQYGFGPYSTVSFHWPDIPEKFREPEATQGRLDEGAGSCSE